MAPLSDSESVSGALTQNRDKNSNRNSNNSSKRREVDNSNISSVSFITQAGQSAPTSSFSVTSNWEASRVVQTSNKRGGFEQERPSKGYSQVSSSAPSGATDDDEESQEEDEDEEVDKDEDEEEESEEEEEEEEEEKSEGEIEEEGEERPRRASSDAKSLQTKAKKISRCLSSGETQPLASHSQLLKPSCSVERDKRATDVKGAKVEERAKEKEKEKEEAEPERLLKHKPANQSSTNLGLEGKNSLVALGPNTQDQINKLNSNQQNDSKVKLGSESVAPDGSSWTATGSQSRVSGVRGAKQQQQQKQMFSLKQLAINPRNLTRRKFSVQGNSQSEQHGAARTVLPLSSSQLTNQESQEQNSSSSGSSIELAIKRNFRRGFKQELEQQTTETELDALFDKENNNLFDDEELTDEDLSADDDDDDDDGQDDDSELNAEDEDEERDESNLIKNGQQTTREQERRRKKRARRPSSFLFRRPSCCNCEQLISKIDGDGLPVTDVDLVTYKDLCQMEQQAQQLRRTKRRNFLEAPGSSLSRVGSSLSWQSSSIRRSSLQEESGAYYQLCTSNEEQLIRQKYAWFPPSLQQLQQVDEFFANFPKDKIPYSSSTAAQASDKEKEKEKACSSLLSTKQEGDKTSINIVGSKKKPETSSRLGSLAPASYRDEQISLQLPRQDISLDYCSYPMSDSSRAAYLQFVDKRNSQALDVGSVIHVRLNTFSGQQTPLLASQKPPPSPKLAFSSQASSHSPGLDSRQFQRKASTVSQQEQLVGVAHSSACSGAQRCRRCLVRFEDKQVAVMAPNFIIGSTAFYRPSSIIPPALEEGVEAATSSATSRELKSSTGQSAANVALFHPNCFTCSTCKEFLVDLVYCLRDNKLYCLRHYGESLRPRCSWCQELIFSDEYLKAMNESFHVDHFLCRHCDTNLAGQRYVLKEEKPFCIQCYEGNFANICEDCQKPIGIDSRDLSYKDRHWHDTCFTCNKCQQSLIDKPFGSKTEKVYCADCYDVTFATRCDGCKNPFRAGSKKMEYRGKQWHDSCFCCCVCQNTIGSNSFIPKNEEIYCIKCYEDKFATKCTKCKQVIVSGGVTFRNEPWHKDCFNCCNCNKSLAGQRFTTRDVKNETVKNTNKTNQPHNAYCIDCYGELFAKKCFACTQAITGLGGTRFVTFEERSWHNDCFLCNDCNTSLVGKGFITDGPETILCSECARAKLSE